MHKTASISKILTLLIVVCIAAGFMPRESVTAQTSTVKAPYLGIWLTAQELSALPVSGYAWYSLLTAANSSPGTPDISNQDSNNDVYVLAKALVYARTGDAKYRTQVVDQLRLAMNTEAGGRTLALGRNLVSYVIAADLINLPLDSSLDQSFRLWLRKTLTEPLDGRTLVSTHEDRPNNWGTHAGASRAAVALYLGDRAELDRTAKVFAGWLGDRAAYSGFQYGELDWQCNPSAPVGINLKGCIKNGQNIDGALPEEMRRGGAFTWPPTPTDYAWEAMQGAVVQAVLLSRAGYPALEWSNKAILRAYQFLYRIGWKDEGDDRWQVWLLNNAYGTNYTTSPAGYGKNMGWTDWTHASKSVLVPLSPPSTPTSAPTLAPTAQPTATKVVTLAPTQAPTLQPTSTPAPTSVPTQPPAQSGLIKEITFENGSLIDSQNGVDRTTGNVALSCDNGMSGSCSASVLNAEDAYLQEDFNSAGNFSVTLLVYLNNLPSDNARILMISNGGETTGNLFLRSDGALQLRNGSKSIGSPSSRLDPKKLYLVRLVQKQGSGGNAVLEAYLAPADAPLGAPFASLTNGSWTTQATYTRFGATAGSRLDARFDNIRLEQLP